jgi:hypothetical protein
MFGPLCQRRITAGMRHAAATGLIFHLWWHPHNFGSHVDDNMALLRQILEHYRALAQEHGMVSRSMAEVAAATRDGVGHTLPGLRAAQPAELGRDSMQAARVSITAT